MNKLSSNEIIKQSTIYHPHGQNALVLIVAGQ